MNDPKPAAGTVTWFDLTVDNASELKAFYEQVVGWTNMPVDMGGYEDFCMNASDGQTIAGICNAKGPNSGIPPVWMMYINVDDIQATVDKCKANGGDVIGEPRSAGGGLCAILRDPSGAVFAVYQAA
ncbi:MAG: VOC family protein [Pirellulaceae bacterium]|nr:VOC family protein [Pirellulaceae bacterium]